MEAASKPASTEHRIFPMKKSPRSHDTRRGREQRATQAIYLMFDGLMFDGLMGFHVKPPSRVASNSLSEFSSQPLEASANVSAMTPRYEARMFDEIEGAPFRSETEATVTFFGLDPAGK